MRIAIPGSNITIDTSTTRLRGSKRVRLITLGLILLALITWRPSPPFPPSYPEVSAEQAVRHEGKIVRFDQTRGDFSEQLQRILLHRHLALISGRSYAYDPIQVDSTIFPFQLFRWPWRTARVPLSAFLSLNGGVPSSATSCSTITEIEAGSLEQVQAGLKSDDACVRVQGDLFSDEFFRSSQPIEMMEGIKTPLYTPSPRVLAVLNSVLPAIAPDAEPSLGRKPIILRHLLVLELPGGKAWDETCQEAFQQSRPFHGFNTLPEHPGNEEIPPAEDMPEPARQGVYKAKCHPEMIDIIARARRMRKNHPLLKAAYVVTDAPTKWVNEARKWLLTEGWEQVWIGRRDVWGDTADREVGQMVELEMARRAGVYVGNGFSTFSSNVVLIRRKDGIHPDLTQFW